MSGNAYIDPRARIIAFWSPKCACTSVDHWFARGVLALNPVFQKFIDTELKQYGPNQEGAPRLFLAKYGLKYSFPQTMRHVQSGDYFIVHFTRHPASRLVSAFLNKCVVYKGNKLNTFESLEPFAKSIVRNIYRINGWDDSNYRGIRFVDLVDYLESVICQPASGVRVDHHWDTQLPGHIVRMVNIKPDYIVHAENFFPEIEVLNSKLGIDFVPERFNITSFDSQDSSPDDLSAAFSRELSEMNVRITAANLLNRDILEKIGRIYAVDYRYFGYDPGKPGMPVAPTNPP